MNDTVSDILVYTGDNREGPMRGFGRLFCAGLVSCAGLALSPAALADSNGSDFSPTGKGVVGGALLGAESVMLVEAAADVKPAWAYAVGGGLGAIGGGVGGYFAEKADSGSLSMYLLVGGMALAIPTTVAVLSATASEPVNYVEDRPAADEPVADPAQPTPAPVAPVQPSGKRQVEPRGDRVASKAPKLPPALVGVDEGALTLSVPAVEVRHVYTRTEIATLGVKQATEVAVPVLNVVS
jgi:hypothetical protein